MSNTVFAIDTTSGQVGEVPESYLTHPVLGLTLVKVSSDTKSFDPALYKPKTKDEFVAAYAEKSGKTDEKTPVTPEHKDEPKNTPSDK